MGQYTFFGDVVGRADWEAIQDQLALALRMEVHTLGPDGADLCSPSRVSRFRQLLETSPAARRRIPDGRLDVVQRTGERGELLVEETGTGRLRFAVPIFFGGEHLATVSGGGRVVAPLSWDQIEALATASELPVTELAAAAAELEIGDRDTMYVAGELIASLLAQLVAAVAHRREAETLAQQVAAVARVGHIVTASLETGRVMEAVIDAIPEVMGADGCVIALVDDDGVLRTRAYRGVSPGYGRLEVRSGQGLTGTVLATGRALNVSDMNLDPRSTYRTHDVEEGLRGLLAVPLRDGEAVLGVLSVFRREAGLFAVSDEQLLLNFAEYTAAAVRNAQLFERMGRAYRELGRATRRLNEIQEQMLHADRLAEVGRLAGGAAHEMRNTLGGIIGAAATVRDHLDHMSEEDVRELVAAIAEEGWRLRDTLEEVRGYAKPRHLGGGTHPLRRAIDETVRLMQFDAAFARLTVSVICPDDIDFVGDRDGLKQVLLNLLRNAGDAVAEVPDREPVVSVEAESVTDGVVLRVTDNGVGIPADRLERIWEPFYTTKGKAGTGLGLDLVRQIVVGQGGEIGVASRPGEGTIFTLRLPGGQRQTPAED
ncbi:MAG: GAF domain-containing protein [Armatimonadetes bacterium]|nr:GAF domain-containing protein [Armatimonadota bacterium]